MAKAQLLKSHWRVQARIEEVAEILGEVENLPSWWGDVYLDVEQLEAGDENGLGRRVRFHSRGFLPYTLHWEGKVIAADRPHSWTIKAEGDLNGRGIWQLQQDGEIADIRYDWHVEVDKPVLRLVAPLLWPVYRANHRWAMARGLTGLQAELAHRSNRPA